jgi:hypothetical protein
MQQFVFWIGLAILGFLLYVSPGFLVQRMYEDFNATPAQAPAQAPAQQAQEVALAPSPPPKITPPSQNQIENLQRLLDTPVLESPTATPKTPQSQGTRQQPAEYEKIRSAPSHPAVITSPNLSLGHGQSFLSSMPTEVSPVSRGTQCLYAPQRMQGTLAPAMVESMRRIPQVPGYNPNCPDMRDYIRKDSIPCWGCKLR